MASTADSSGSDPEELIAIIQAALSESSEARIELGRLIGLVSAQTDRNPVAVIGAILEMQGRDLVSLSFAAADDRIEIEVPYGEA